MTLRSATARYNVADGGERSSTSSNPLVGNELLNIRINTLSRRPTREHEPIYEQSGNESYDSDYEDISDL